jgi:hypothetical protein
MGGVVDVVEVIGGEVAMILDCRDDWNEGG